MAKKSKLLAALDAHKGRDYKLEKQKKLQRQAVKRKKARLQIQSAEAESEIEAETKTEIPINGRHELGEESEGWESDGGEDALPQTMDVAGIDDSDSESSSSLEHSPSHHHYQTPSASAGSSHHKDGVGEDEGIREEIEEQEDDDDDEDDEDDDTDAIPFSDIESLSSAERGDIVPHQRLTINNTAALLRALKSIALPLSAMPFSEHQALTAPELIPIPDINDDLTRELAFYKQCLDAATRGRALLVKEGVPFSRPADYFAEMVKTDEHMGKIRQKMTDEEAGKRAAAEARKQRDLKRFGKQVQVAKLQERDKAKRDTLDKINLLKRKRRNTDTATANEDELFDVALENATEKNYKPARTRFNARNGGGGDAGHAGPSRSSKRQKKDSKFGFGGKKRFAKSGDAVSSGDVRGYSNRATRGVKGLRKGGGGLRPRPRLGKSRRAKQA